MKGAIVMSIAAAMTAGASAKVLPPPPPPVINVPDIRATESPVQIEQNAETVAENELYKRVRTTFTFTNPNSRVMSADFEFPIPPEATVCAYALEINGDMVPGVVVEKEAARVAFETEKAKNVDPGIVEHVAGNIWRTRIFPLQPKTPRKASVDYITPVEEPSINVCAERDGEDVYIARVALAGCDAPRAETAIAAFGEGIIAWDSSSSAELHKDAWLKRLAALPETGAWRLFAIRNDLEEVGAFKEKSALLAAIEALVYDGGTDLAGAFAGDTLRAAPCLLFSDELDTMGLEKPAYERLANVTVASRPDAPAKSVRVERLGIGEALPDGLEATEGTLLATAWAADRIQELSSQAEARREEFLALGRKYGVASPVTSLIVLESLDQYITHKIEPPASMSFHDEWVKWRKAQDDEISRKEADADHERALLQLWKERVEWWNNPIPPKQTPKSGLFDTVAEAVGGMFGSRSARALSARSMEASDGAAEDGMAEMSAGMAAPDVESEAPGLRRAAPMAMPLGGDDTVVISVEDTTSSAAAGTGGASITLMPWQSDAKYVKQISSARDPYAEYLKLKADYGASPAFFMDVATWFFTNEKQKAAGPALALRIISNMAEFKLDDAAVWRCMGWRLREAGQYEAAIRCFSHALKKRSEEGQSRRDLAIVLAEYGKATKDAAMLSRAMALFHEAAFTDFARRGSRRSNDRQVSIIALEELNALASWCNAAGIDVAVPQMDSAFRRDLPVKIRIVLSWDTDETDIDIHVLEPGGEEAYYGHRRTSDGGFVSEDVTTGYGPEEYLRKEGTGKFKILTNYYASHQTALTGATTATATIYTDWGTAAEQMKIMTLRLDKPKDKHLIGEIKVRE